MSFPTLWVSTNVIFVPLLMKPCWPLSQFARGCTFCGTKWQDSALPGWQCNDLCRDTGHCFSPNWLGNWCVDKISITRNNQRNDLCWLVSSLAVLVFRRRPLRPTSFSGKTRRQHDSGYGGYLGRSEVSIFLYFLTLKIVWQEDNPKPIHRLFLF